MTVVEDLAAWLTAVWDEEERLASEALERTADAYPSDRFKVSWRWARAWEFHPSGAGGITTELGAPSPSQVLARIAADRKILALHREIAFTPLYKGGVEGQRERYCENCWYGDECGGVYGYPCPTLRLLASPYADREGFRSEWLVERQGVEG